jgi:hypothetical protein
MVSRWPEASATEEARPEDSDSSESENVDRSLERAPEVEFCRVEVVVAMLSLKVVVVCSW